MFMPCEIKKVAWRSVSFLALVSLLAFVSIYEGQTRAFPMYVPFYARWSDEELLIIAFDAWREEWLDDKMDAFEAAVRRTLPGQPLPHLPIWPPPQGMQPTPLPTQDQPEAVPIQPAPLPAMSSSDPYAPIHPMPTRPVPISLEDLRASFFQTPKARARSGILVGPRPRRRSRPQAQSSSSSSMPKARLSPRNPQDGQPPPMKALPDSYRRLPPGGT